MAFRDAVRGLGMALGFKLAADKFKRDVAREVATELDRREAKKRRGDSTAAILLILGIAAVFTLPLLWVWAKDSGLL